MAAVNIYPAKINFNKPVAETSGTLVTSASDGCHIVLNGLNGDAPVSVKDEALLIILENTDTSALTVNVKAGNSWGGVNDLSVSVPASTKHILRVEGAKYKHTSGDYKGKVVIIPATASKLKVSAYDLA